MTDLDRLEALARKATAGPWHYEDGRGMDGIGPQWVQFAGSDQWGVMVTDDHGTASYGDQTERFPAPANAAFIAAANPAVVLALVEQARRADGSVIAEIRRRLDELPVGDPGPYADGYHLAVETVRLILRMLELEMEYAAVGADRAVGR